MDHYDIKLKNPEAHAIQKPGRRLLTKVPLRFVWEKVHGQKKHGVNASLNLVSFIDFLVVTVAFLLISFSASGEMSLDKKIVLPRAENARDLAMSPMVILSKNEVSREYSIVVNGVLATTIPFAKEQSFQKIDPLHSALKSIRDQWLRDEPGKPFPGICSLQVDQSVRSGIVKSVFQTAAFAGYPTVHFMVLKGR